MATESRVCLSITPMLDTPDQSNENVMFAPGTAAAIFKAATNRNIPLVFIFFSS